jgi:hypothetical protein
MEVMDSSEGAKGEGEERCNRKWRSHNKILDQFISNPREKMSP